LAQARRDFLSLLLLNTPMAGTSSNDGLAPALSPVQRQAAKQAHPLVPGHCVVTGGSGFVGQRLVEMLVERGAQKVVSFDISPAPPNSWDHPKIDYIQGDLRNPADVAAAVAGADCVWHIGAAVGPFHPYKLYEEVNFEGTKHVIKACLTAKVPKIVMSSSPSTRFDGTDIDGLSETQLPPLPQKTYLQDYARTKAMGEKAMTEACCDELLTIAVAPHQVYGPRDTLFLPNMLETAGTGKLRIFGEGKNRICFTHVDNYCHGLILAERALYVGSPALGQFYICTDAHTHPHSEGYCIFWEELDKAIVGCGFAPVGQKMHLPVMLMFFLAYVCNIVGFLLRTKLKLTPFTVKLLIMHRWFTYERAEKDLKYKPIIHFKEGWEDTIEWFKQQWLPLYYNRREASGYGAIHSRSQQKIDMQNKKVD